MGRPEPRGLEVSSSASRRALVVLGITSAVLVLTMGTVPGAWPIGTLIASGISLVLAWLSYRAARIGLYADEECLLIRYFFRDHVLPWTEVVGFEVAEGSSFSPTRLVEVRLADGSTLRPQVTARSTLLKAGAETERSVLALSAMLTAAQTRVRRGQEEGDDESGRGSSSS